MWAWGRLPGVSRTEPDIPPEVLGRELVHIDCFAGPGGICTGFRAAGIRTIAAVERVRSCAETYLANHPHVRMLQKDIRDVGAEDFAGLLPSGGIDILTSGMPCETFSTAGCKSRSFYDARQFLFREAIRLARIVSARIVLFENVPGIASKRAAKNGGECILWLLGRELAQAGYGNQAVFELNAADYGVPQRRRRLFVIASRDPALRLKAPALRRSAPVTVDMAFADLPDVAPNSDAGASTYQDSGSGYSALMRNMEFWRLGEGQCAALTYQKPMRHRAPTLGRFALLGPGESLKQLCGRYQGAVRERLIEEKILPRRMYGQRNYRLRADEPSPTVTSHCLDEFVHPVSDRALTVRECARLQSFPDCYDFAGGPYAAPHSDRDVQDKYEQIGDAVPPLLAYAWGREIVNIFARAAGAESRTAPQGDSGARELDLPVAI